MGFKNCCCGCSPRTATLIIGGICLIEQFFWLTVLIGSSAMFSQPSDFPVQSVTMSSDIEAVTFMQNGEKIGFPVQSDVIKPFIFDEKPDSDQDNAPETTGFQTIQVQFGILNDDQDSNKESVSEIHDNVDNYGDTDVDADYYIVPDWSSFLFRIDDKKDDGVPELEDHFPKLDDPVTPLDDDFSKILNEEFSKLDSHFPKLDDDFSKMDDDFLKLDDHFSNFDDILSSAFQDFEPATDKSDNPGDKMTLSDISKTIHQRNKRDIGINQGMVKKMEVDSTEFIVNAIVISFSVFVTFLLILGAVKGYGQLLMIWMMHTSFLSVLYLSWAIILIDTYFQYPNENYDHPGQIIVFNLIHIVVNIFMVMVVYSHYKELKQQGNKDNNLKYFTNNKPWTDSTIAIVPVSEKEKEFV